MRPADRFGCCGAEVPLSTRAGPSDAFREVGEVLAEPDLVSRLFERQTLRVRADVVEFDAELGVDLLVESLLELRLDHLWIDRRHARAGRQPLRDVVNLVRRKPSLELKDRVGDSGRHAKQIVVFA